MNEGKKDRRDPIRTIKAKNPVAKNANKAIGGGAAGPMKDKKKAEKKGEVKHKKKEVAESYEDRLTRQLNELSIDSLKSYKAKRQVQQDAAKAATPNPRTGDKDWIDQAVRGINMNTAQKKINRKEKNMSEMTNAEIAKIRGDAEAHAKQTMDKQSNARIAAKKNPPKEKSFMQKVGDKQIAMVKGAWKGLTQEDIHGKSPFEAGAADAYYGRNFIHMVQDYGLKPGTPEFSEYVAGFHSEDGKDGKDYGNARPGPVHARRITRTPEAMNGITGPGMMDTRPTEGEGDTEGLEHLTPELAKHIADQIDSEGAHAIVKSVEWGDGAAKELTEFIKAALLKLASVGGMKEDTALAKFRKGSAEREKKHSDIEAKRKAAPAGSGMKSAIDRLEKQVKGEGWTHDSLADELFEHERTYEEQLAGKLARQLKK